MWESASSASSSMVDSPALRRMLFSESLFEACLRLGVLLVGMPPGRGAGEGVADGDGNKIFGEEERRGMEGVREREEERRGWSCARPSEKASLAGRVMIVPVQDRKSALSASLKGGSANMNTNYP